MRPAGAASWSAGSPSAAGDGRLFNSAAVVDRDGVVAVYRKTHLWDREKLWFEAGRRAASGDRHRVGRIGVAICYDLEFPEVTRHLALAGPS